MGIAPYIALMAVVIIAIDVLFGIVLVFTAFYFRFFKRQ
jgi:hypothetical protein